MSKAAKSFTDPSKSIFVRGLHSSVTEEILWELFLQAGPLASVKIPINRDSGKPKTYGFVTYQDACSVPYACELFDSLKLFGRPINCKPQNSTNNSKPEYQGQSPNHLTSSPDENLSNPRRFQEIRRTPSLQFFGVDESPYGRTPNMTSIKTQPLLQRSVSSGSILPRQALMMQTFPMRMDVGGLLDTPIRRDRFIQERRQNFESQDRRYRAKPY